MQRGVKLRGGESRFGDIGESTPAFSGHHQVKQNREVKKKTMQKVTFHDMQNQ
jgi:hypothetical protein